TFNDFLIYSFPLMIVVWIAAVLSFKVLFRGELAIHPDRFAHVESLDPWKEIKDRVVARKVLIVFAGAIALFVLHNALSLTPAFVALTAAAAALLWVRPDVHNTLERVEWSVLVFFAGLFVMVGGLEASGLMEEAAQSLAVLKDVDPVIVGIIVIWVAGLLSAVVDNIPITIAIIPVMAGLQKEGIDVWPLWWALAFGVGLGGNGTVIGASANVVVVSLSERTETPTTSAYWTRKGLPTMLVTLTVCSALYAVAYYVLYT
ncbi:MAG TPA: SLC13 family permease, partial [Thermoleophilia bacterium]|nr:SLC13 family permease [Thermoleophilia bacterium]